jgi:hypothetical protein
MLYYATVILLHRPFNLTSVHHLRCRNASLCLERLVVCLDSTFGVTRLTYLIAYCIYTGASVLIPDVNAGDLDASTRMQTFLRALKGGVRTCPLVQRSIDIISNSLNAPNQSLDDYQADGVSKTDLTTGRYLPAFPFPEAGADYNIDSNAGYLDIDDFSLLNCFPEYQMGNADSGLYST